MRKPLALAGTSVEPGSRRTVDIPISVMSDHTPVTLSVHVIHGRRQGPTIFVSAAIHGDEIIGVEIVRRLVRSPALRRVAGTVLLIPVVNSYGFIAHSRYLPDRRDLNRSFPGSAKGSLAARLAHLFLSEVVSRCDYGIDLHSAAVHRTNLPQIRVGEDDEKALELARAFGAPVTLKAELRDGSLRHAAHERGVPVMVFEAGEGLRFDEFAIRVGVKGALRVMRHLGMIARGAITDSRFVSPVAEKSSWVRAPQGGILRALRRSGDIVEKGELLGIVSDPFGEREAEVKAVVGGLIVGRANLPVVNQGDALFHIAVLPRAAAAGTALESLEEEFQGDPMFDEDEIL
jgi:predicted deacylase